MSHAPAERCFQQVSADFASFAGYKFLIITDYFTGWPYVFQCSRNATSYDGITRFRKMFCTAVIPGLIWSDGDPLFTSQQFTTFRQRWGIESELSTPHYPQLNGHAEATVKSMKKLLRKCWNNQKGALDMDKWATASLLQYKNTPDASGLSPAQRLLGHPIQDALSVLRSAFSKQWQEQVNQTKTKAAELKQKSGELQC